MSRYLRGYFSLKVIRREVDFGYLVLIQDAVCTSDRLNSFYQLFTVCCRVRCVKLCECFTSTVCWNSGKISSVIVGRTLLSLSREIWVKKSESLFELVLTGLVLIA